MKLFVSFYLFFNATRSLFVISLLLTYILLAFKVQNYVNSLVKNQRKKQIGDTSNCLRMLKSGIDGGSCIRAYGKKEYFDEKIFDLLKISVEN